MAKPTPAPTPPTPSNPNSNNNNNGGNGNGANNNSINTIPSVSLSQNNNIKELSIDGHKLVKVDNNNYTLSVSNDVTSINVNATAEDAKSNVTGTGEHKLNIGENNIEVIVTSESGSQNKINIKVTRKDGYYLEDLESVLNNSKIKDINIIINSDSKITSERLTKIKESGKVVKFNYYDENKKLVYSWILDGSKIKNTEELVLTISYTSENIKEISKLSNYADVLYVSFNHKGNLPEGTKFKLYVGNKFTNGDVVNVYYYDKDGNKLDLVEDDLTVKERYIEFAVKRASDYFVTMSNIGVLNKEVSFSTNLFVIISLVELIAIIAFLVILFIKRKKQKNNIITENDTANLNNTNIDLLNNDNK